MKNVIRLVVALAITIGLTACGGGDSSGGGEITPTLQTGIFVDAPVEGLRYTTATQSGYTSDKALFKYREGEAVTFYLGNLSLGTTLGKAVITPITLSNDSVDTKAVNIARVLQSIDSNPASNGTIIIPTNARDINLTGLDWTDEGDLNTILEKFEDVASESYSLQNSTDARTLLTNFHNAYTGNVLISGVAYPVAANGVKYVLFIKNDAVVQFSTVKVPPTSNLACGMAMAGDTDENVGGLTENTSLTLAAGTYTYTVQNGSNVCGLVGFSFTSLQMIGTSDL